MKHATQEALGPPSVKLEAFQVWVHSRQFPESHDEWDGNWLNVTAHCGRGGADVWVTGAVLDTVAFLRFRDELHRLHASLTGEAELASIEPYVQVRVVAKDGTGHLTVRVELTPDNITQSHWFEFEIDQSYLPATVAQLEEVVARFPFRGTKR